MRHLYVVYEARSVPHASYTYAGAYALDNKNTDTTAHESLPVDEDTYRQYFRFVTSAVSVWYENHSTKNPLGIVPDPRYC